VQISQIEGPRVELNLEQWKVHYVGWNAKNDEWVTVDKMVLLVASKPPASPLAAQARSQAGMAVAGSLLSPARRKLALNLAAQIPTSPSSRTVAKSPHVIQINQSVLAAKSHSQSHFKAPSPGNPFTRLQASALHRSTAAGTGAFTII
jgi:hypothetical protein